MKRLAALVLLLVAPAANAAYSSRRVVLPIVGRVTATGGLEYMTTLWITNRADKPLRARISFLQRGQANPEPVFRDVDVAAEQTLQLDNVTETLLHAPGKLGALLIEADRPIACSARVAAAAQGGGFTAMPIELAIPRGGSTLLPGAGSGQNGEFRYNIHLVETNRSAIEAVVSLLDANGRELGSKPVILRELEAMTIPVAQLAASVPPEATVRIRVTKGSGKLVAAGSRIAVTSLDPTSFEMLTGEVPRPAMPANEIAAYVAAAIAIAIAAVVRLKSISGV
ncbi:MAG: hypothetical protein QOI24_935 [Acidobacteriota bacterium]|jgi:hypothetical protein|nr:hypothetical protein [Acidobacteriota bacterium]